MNFLYNFDQYILNILNAISESVIDAHEIALNVIANLADTIRFCNESSSMCTLFVFKATLSSEINVTDLKDIFCSLAYNYRLSESTVIVFQLATI